ncbi:MAG: MBL fold metallo-hydrolase [Pseudomonadota bacterium]
MTLRYRVIPVTPFEQNCSVIWDSVSLQAAIIDPGGDAQRIESVITEEGLKPEKILLTHGHIDHVGATNELAGRFGIPVEGPHPEERFWLESMDEQARMFGFSSGDPVEPDRWLGDGDRVSVGQETLEVIYCPGHTPGHVVFFHRGQRLAFVGDVLFRGSIGRTDFPRGNLRDLLSSIRNKLFPLGDDVAFVPGHGPMSTFGEERRNNPFVRQQ